MRQQTTQSAGTGSISRAIVREPPKRAATSHGVLQRKCTCGGTPGPTGECGQCRRRRKPHEGGRLQTRMRANTPGDRYEREADRVAEQVMRMPASSRPSPPRRSGNVGEGGELQRKTAPQLRITPLAQRQTSRGTEESERSQSRPEHRTALATSRDVGHGLEILPGNGKTLPPETQQFMGARFGYDFGSVRVHTGDRAAEAARHVSARAFTLGNDVVFGAGAYAPHSAAGKKLLAHELTHVVQQQGHRSAVQRVPVAGETASAAPPATTRTQEETSSPAEEASAAPGSEPDLSTPVRAHGHFLCG